MNSGYQSSNILTDIDTIYLEGNGTKGWFKKAVLHDHLKTNPHTIKVNISPYPYLIPALSTRQEKYVRSESNDSEHDNLLKLPRV
jgi:hypothetical protein